MNRRAFLKHLAAAGAAWPMAAASAEPRPAAPKPNILLIIADDTTWAGLGCYGGTAVATPRIDRLAAEGMQFRRAYVAMAMCVPCRHELYTGLYPLRSGCSWNHCVSKPGTKSICRYLGDLGYRVGLTGKCHAQPRDVFPFEIIPGFVVGCCHDEPVSRADVGPIKAFMTRNSAQPFCLAVGLVDAHMPWTTGDPSKFDKATVALPPDLPDLPAVRDDYVKYLAEVAELDRIVGTVLDALDETGRRNDTLVLFTSEQGAQWPGGKWTTWEAGLHTALVCRWPGHVVPGAVTEALVQYADILPTLVEAAGGHINVDGASFLGVLEGKRAQHRDYAYAMHNNCAAGPPYPVRSVTDGRFRYIRNLKPEAEFIQKHMEQTIHMRGGHLYWKAWKKAAEQEGRPRELFLRFRKRPPEELYDSSTDPFCLDNLAGRPEYAAVQQRLSQALEEWMREQGDPGAALDTPENFYAHSLRKYNADNKKRKKTGRSTGRAH